jgi:hypothetical protein
MAAPFRTGCQPTWEAQFQIPDRLGDRVQRYLEGGHSSAASGGGDRSCGYISRGLGPWLRPGKPQEVGVARVLGCAFDWGFAVYGLGFSTIQIADHPCPEGIVTDFVLFLTTAGRQTSPPLPPSTHTLTPPGLYIPKADFKKKRDRPGFWHKNSG